MGAALIYVMGPSGAGKDTLIEIARGRLAGLGGVKFASRYITREASSGDEDFRPLSQPDFDGLEAEGHFLFSWRSHGLSYGLDRQVERDLKGGLVVVVNGSRAYLPTALGIYPDLQPVLITADEEILAARLKKRGRETSDQQSERLSRKNYDFKGIQNLYTIDNSGELKLAADRFCSFLSARIKFGDHN